jgi:oxygen-independent coproporphyrinogen-3 oxidase
MDTLYKNLYIDDNAEITIEANPETVNLEYLQKLRRLGFNRLSLGVQTFDDELLKRLNRAHTAEAARDAYAAACEAGFENVSIDLMFSIPGQDINSFEQSLTAALDLSPEHISCYGLTVETTTPLGKEGYEPDEDADREMYSLARQELIIAGYEHYEISNFALPGYRSRHNTAYWTGGEYAGFGLGAHSLLNKTRFNNEHNLNKYIVINGAKRLNVETLGKNALMSEYVIACV